MEIPEQIREKIVAARLEFLAYIRKVLYMDGRKYPFSWHWIVRGVTVLAEMHLKNQKCDRSFRSPFGYINFYLPHKLPGQVNYVTGFSLRTSLVSMKAVAPKE